MNLGPLWRWTRGRQGSGYDKLRLWTFRWPLPCDGYLLRYPVGSFIPPHRDPVPGFRHVRANLVLRPARTGGQFKGEPVLVRCGPLVVFRSDTCTHAVSLVEGRARWVLSVGWLLRDRV